MDSPPPTDSAPRVVGVGRVFLDADPARSNAALRLVEQDGTLRLIRPDGEEAVVSKKASAEDLVRAMQAVADRPDSLPAPGEADLSDREVQVLKLIAVGYSNKEIAAQLVLSVKTVETYKMRSSEKLGIRGRVDLVRYAARRGWLSSL